jgi:hypothetical protein
MQQTAWMIKVANQFYPKVYISRQEAEEDWSCGDHDGIIKVKITEIVRKK